MRSLKFQTRLPHGEIAQLSIESERVLIGSGAHCEIRLPLAEARVEHVLIELGPAGIFARALSFEPPPTINNVPFTQAPLPPGSVLGVTGTQIFVEVVEGNQGQPGLGNTQEKKKSPVMLIALLLILPAAGYLFLGGDDAAQRAADEARPQPPELWAPPATTCPHARDRNEAVSFARDRMGAADAKRERRPFHVQDGIQAVPIYETAAACFRAGADNPNGQLADDSAKYLRREMTDDFRMRRVRLDHALSIDDYVSAQKEVRVLLQFVEGKQGEYVTWLATLDRKLKIKIGDLKDGK